MAAKKPKTNQKHTCNLTPRMKAFAESYVRGNDGRVAALEAGYGQRVASGQVKRIRDNPKVKAYIEELREDIIHTAGLDCTWFLEKCMRVFDNCSELIDDKKGGWKVRDSTGAARMGAIIKDAIPNFKQRFEHTITDPQSFKIGDQEITF